MFISSHNTYIYIYTTDNNNKVIMILQHTLWDSINLTFMVKKQCINLICFLVWNCKNWDIPPYKIYKINVAAFDTMHQNITSQFCSKGLLYWYLKFITKKILEKNFQIDTFLCLVTYVHANCHHDRISSTNFTHQLWQPMILISQWLTTNSWVLVD